MRWVAEDQRAVEDGDRGRKPISRQDSQDPVAAFLNRDEDFDCGIASHFEVDFRVGIVIGGAVQ